MTKAEREALEAVAKAIALADGWDRWDTAKTFNDTPSGNTADECRDGYRDLAEAAIKAFRLATLDKPATTGTCPHGYPQTVRCSRCGE